MKTHIVQLYNALVSDGVKFPSKVKDSDSFEKQYFLSENTTNNFYDWLHKTKFQKGPNKGKVVYFPKDKKRFYEVYVCDLNWAKDLKICGGTGGNQQEDPINWDTITDAELLRRIKTGGEEFWKKIKRGIPSLIKKGGKWIYNTKEDLEAWWEKHKNDSIIQPPKPPHTDDTDEIPTSTEWLTDPTGSKMYVYQVSKNCKWLAKRVKTGRIFNISDNPKYDSSVQILNKAYADLVKDCNPSTTDTSTASTVNTTVDTDTTPANLPEWAVCIKIIKNLKLSQDSDGKEIVIAAFGNDLGFFWEDFTFLYVSKDGTKVYGKWSCKNNSLVITTEDGQVWTASSGWVTSPDKTRKPEQNFFGSSWTTPDELSGTNKPEISFKPEVKKSSPFSELSNKKFPEIKGFDINKPLNLNQNESAMDALERVINEVNNFIIEQTQETQEVVMAPADELNALQTNPILKNTGTLETLCRTKNQTSKPVVVEGGKVYFAGKSFKLKDGSTAYLTYNGTILVRQGDSCEFKYLRDNKGVISHIKGIPFEDIAPQQTEILRLFGINPLDYNSDPYYQIRTLTDRFQDLINTKKARSMVFKSWNDMLTYWDPNRTKLLPVNETSMTYPPNDELDQYNTVTADALGLTYMDKQIKIFIPRGERLTNDFKGAKYDPAKCRADLVAYLSAAFEFEKQGTANNSLNSNAVRKGLQGCYRSGVFDKMSPITATDIDVQFTDKDNPFTGLRGFGSDLDIKDVQKLLTGEHFKLPKVGPSGKNPFLPLTLDTRQMNESKVKLTNLIKENLQKLSEQKTNNLLAETRIIQTRTKILTENRILKFKQPREKFFNEIISEAMYLNSQGFDKQLIKEEFWESLKGLFGEHGSNAIFSTFKEYMGKHLVDKLTSINPNGWMGEKIKKAINDIHIEDLDKIVDCDFIAKKISSSMSDAIISKVSKNQDIENNDISSIVKDGLDKSIDRTELTKNIHKGVHKLICPVLGNISNKLKDKAQEMKTKAVQP